MYCYLLARELTLRHHQQLSMLNCDPESTQLIGNSISFPGIAYTDMSGYMFSERGGGDTLMSQAPPKYKLQLLYYYYWAHINFQ